MTSAPEERPPLPQGLKLLLDLGPLVLFFAVYRTTDLLTATAVLMVGVTVAILAGWFLERRVHPMPLVTLVFVLVLGGLTLWLKDDRFIKLKPTLLYSIAAAFLLGGLALGRAPLGWLLGSAMELDDAGWRKLTLRFGLFFVVMAIANEVIWRNFSEDLWVKVKVFGFTAATFLFLMTQAPLLRDHALEESE